MDKSFILKSVQDEWMKIGIEFNKRLDSELPFFYSSTVHDRFYTYLTLHVILYRLSPTMYIDSALHRVCVCVQSHASLLCLVQVYPHFNTVRPQLCSRS